MNGAFVNHTRWMNVFVFFNRFTKDRFEEAIKWKTILIKILFPLKDRSIHPSCLIYKGTCSYDETYIRQTICNALIR